MGTWAKTNTDIETTRLRREALGPTYKRIAEELHREPGLLDFVWERHGWKATETLEVLLAITHVSSFDLIRQAFTQGATLAKAETLVKNRAAAASQAARTRAKRAPTARERSKPSGKKAPTRTTPATRTPVTKAARTVAPEQIDSKVLDLAKAGPFVIGKVLLELQCSRSAATSSIKRLLKGRKLTRQGTGRFASYSLAKASAASRQLEMPGANGAGAEV